MGVLKQTKQFGVYSPNRFSYGISDGAFEQNMYILRLDMKRLWLYMVGLGLLLAGCGSVTAPTSVPPQVNNGEQAYPVIDEPVADDPSLPTPVLTVDGPDFSIEPLKAGDTVIRGTGPVGLIVDVIDVSAMGQLLGKVQIDETGSFALTTEAPLEGQHIVGIALPLNTRTTVEVLTTLRNKAGERPRDYPEVGFVYDSEIIQK